MTDESNKNSRVDLMQTLREVGEELARQLKDATAMNVETYIKVVGEEAGEELVASTSIELDGDTKMVVPVRREGNALVRDVELLQLHQVSVDNAVSYRTKLVDRVMEVARQVRSR